MPGEYLPPVITRLSMDIEEFAAKAAEAKRILRDLGKDVNARITVTVRDDVARARLAELARDRTVKITPDVDTSATRSLLSRLLGLGGFGGPGGGPSSLFTTMMGSSGFLSKIPAIASGPALLGALGIAGSLLTEITGLVSGFAAAGAGGLAFAGLAYPAISAVNTAYQNVSGGQTALTHAQNVYNADPSSTNAKALQQAKDNLAAYNKEVQQLGPQGASAVGQVGALIGKGGAIEAAFQPTAVKVFNQALKVLNDMLPHVLPFAETFGNVLAGMLKHFDGFAKSKGFQNWLSSFHSLEGPALNSIFTGIGKVVVQIGKLFTVMSSKDVAHAINIAFDTIAGVLIGLRYTIQFLMNVWDGAVIAWKTGSHDIAKAFDQTRHGIASTADQIGHDFMSMVKWPLTVAKKIADIFDGLKRTLIGTFANAPYWLEQSGKWIVQGLINGIESMIPGLQGTIVHLAGIVKSIAGFLRIKSPSMVMFEYGQYISQGLALGMEAGFGRVRQAAGGLALAAVPAGTGGGGGIVVHSHVYLDSKQIYSGVQKQAVTTQRRTGHNGLSKRTR